MGTRLPEQLSRSAVPPSVDRVLHFGCQPLDQSANAALHRLSGHRFRQIGVHASEDAADVGRVLHSFGRLVQPSLRVSHPADPDEQEAEAVADRVVSGSAAGQISGTTTVVATKLHRLSAELDPSLDDISIDAEDSGGTVQALHAPAASRPAAAINPRVLGDAAGQPMDASVRGSMQERFGVDFSRVRIHTDRHAADLAESIGARAFTYGADIFFGTAEYRPGSSEGARVLAHELTHVVQQATAGPSPAERCRVARLGAPGPAVERNVKPWGDNGPIGSNHEAGTDGGSAVTVWVAYPVWNEAK